MARGPAILKEMLGHALIGQGHPFGFTDMIAVGLERLGGAQAGPHLRSALRLFERDLVQIAVGAARQGPEVG